MEPVVGFEPTTDGLQNRCSTTELNWLFILKIQRILLLFHKVFRGLHAQFVDGMVFQL